MPSLDHTHTYVRWKTTKLGVTYFRCNHANCTHFIDKELIVGKTTLCSNCGGQFILSRDDLRRAKPKCLDCSNTKEAKISRAARELMDSILPEEDILLDKEISDRDE